MRKAATDTRAGSGVVGGGVDGGGSGGGDGGGSGGVDAGGVDGGGVVVGADHGPAAGSATLRSVIEVTRPFAGAPLLDFLHRHLVAGVETGEVLQVAGRAEVRYARTVGLPHGPATVRLTWAEDSLAAEVTSDRRDQAEGLRRLQHLVDADTDPAPVDAHLGSDPHLSSLVRETPGLRVPGVVDVAEMVFRTVLGQQISLAAARTCAATLTQRYGERMDTGIAGLDHLFPTAAAFAEADPATLPMPGSRGRALVGLAQRITDGRLDLSDEVDAGTLRKELLACPGIGPWTADYVLMRARHAPDVLLTNDLIIARELVAREVTDPAAWSPYRSYAAMHLWHDFLNPVPG